MEKQIGRITKVEENINLLTKTRRMERKKICKKIVRRRNEDSLVGIILS